MNFFKTTLFTLVALTLLVIRPHDPLIFAQTDMSTARRSSDTPALVAQSAAPARPLGQVQVLSGPDTCDQEDCYQIEVRCPGLAESERATLKVSGPNDNTPQGTIMFMTGGGGTGLWERFGVDAKRVLGELRAAGFRTVQLQWARGWLVGANEALEGQARLACKPATVARWVYDTLNDQSQTPVF